MSKSKYQLKSKSGINYFDSKNDFINSCQESYNECLKKGFSNKKFEIYYSFDFGLNWNQIENFKSERQIIQNEKKVVIDKGENHTKQKSEKNESSLFSKLFKLFLIILAIYGIKSSFSEEPKHDVENPVTAEVVSDTIDSEDTITSSEIEPMDDITETPDESSSPEEESSNISKNDAYKILFGEEMAGDANSEEELKARLKTGKKVTCPTCSGNKNQKFTCPKCNGRILVNCYQCNGQGEWNNEICKRCKGNLRVPCTNCNGTGEINCPTCYASGLVTKYRN